MNRLNKILTVITLLFITTNIKAAKEVSLELAQQILDDLYKVSGQYIQEKPTLILSTENKKVASYSPSKNLISIDEKALEICGSLGNESANALAFLIGHELAHAFQKEVRQQGGTTHFLAYDHHFDSMVRTEKVADIQGVFTGYLANYGMQEAIPAVLKEIYEAYGLMGKHLPNYPTYEERMESATEVIRLVDGLIDLFETNVYLLALGEYREASYVMEYIFEYYQGYEIQNNLGICYLYTALELVDNEIDKFAFPTRLNGASNLHEIDTSRAGALNYYMRKTRNSILQSALNYFDEAIRLNKNHTIAKINRACVLNMLQNQNEALSYLAGNDFAETEKKDPNYILVNGITLALMGEQIEAKKYFTELLGHTDKIISAQAAYNLALLNNKRTLNKSNSIFHISERITNTLERLTLKGTRGWPPIVLNKSENKLFKTNKTKTHEAYLITDEFENYFSLLKIKMNTNEYISIDKKNESDPKIYQNFIYSDKYYFIKSETEKIIIKCDLNGNILELAKYNIY